MRELFIVEHLVQIIYCPFTSGGEYDILNLKGTDIIVKVCRNQFQSITISLL